jgi:Zn-dependent protease
MIKLLLLLLSGAKLGKIAISAGSMLLSLVIYGSIFGWAYGVGLIVMIFVHEMGHYLAARQRGLEVGLPAFIPFVGAWIQLKDKLPNAETEAYVGIAGPAVGSAAAFLCYFWAQYYHDNAMLAVAYAGFMINLFNLLPISPLDGGRITTVLSPKIWIVGVPLLIGLFVINPSPILIIVGLLALPKAWAAWRGRLEESPDYWQVSASERLQYGAAYIVLIMGLGFMSYRVHGMLSGVSS